MYQDSKRTCTAIVQLIKPFVWWRSRCRCRRGFVNSLISTTSHLHFGEQLLNIPQFSELRALRKIVSIWGENMLGYLSLNIICSSQPTVFLELLSRKTVCFSEQIMSADKYPSIFSRQMATIVYIFPNFQNCTCCEKIFERQLTQQPPFGAKMMCSNVCPRILFVPRGSQFSSSYALRKLFASKNR